MSKQSKGKKVGRNGERSKAYRSSQQREVNKARRILKRLKKGLKRGWRPDHVAWDALARLDATVPLAHRKRLCMAEWLARRPARA